MGNVHVGFRRQTIVSLAAGLLVAASVAGGTGSVLARDADPSVVTIRMVTVGDPGNASVGVVSAFGTSGDFVQVPANGGIYANCDAAPAGPPNCITSGAVDYSYQIGELEITVGQYVAFLNTVDPKGKNPHELYIDSASPTVWPKYGSVAFSDASGVADGEHYSVAYPEWQHKPYGFANFLRAARFVNSLFNGKVLSRDESSADGFQYVTYTVRLSPKMDQGMYDLKDSAATRRGDTGFVIPSYDEWMKAAYYDPNGGGTLSYWQYPTGPFDAPNISQLDPATGDVLNASDQPLSTYSSDGPGSSPGTYPTWCPPEAGAEACAESNPLGLPPGIATDGWQGNVSTVGQTLTPSPWGALDMGGNVVEWQDTIVDQPPGRTTPRVWRRMHGGVANAAVYQLLISAIGFQPQDQQFLDTVYPWFGFRVGVIGDLK